MIDTVLFDLGSTLIEYENLTWPEVSKAGLRQGYSFLARLGAKLPPADILVPELDRHIEEAYLQSFETMIEVDLHQKLTEYFSQLNVIHISKICLTNTLMMIQYSQRIQSLQMPEPLKVIS